MEKRYIPVAPFVVTVGRVRARFNPNRADGKIGYSEDEVALVKKHRPDVFASFRVVEVAGDGYSDPESEVVEEATVVPGEKRTVARKKA